MGGLFGVVAESDIVGDLFYGTDYHFHLGTRRGGMAVRDNGEIKRSIHSIENNYFRTKFEGDLTKLNGRMGIGVISDTDSQPLAIGSHLGDFAIATVGRINNIDVYRDKAFAGRHHFTEITGGEINPTEMVAMLICEADTF